MQLVTSCSGDRAVTHIAKQQTQSHYDVSRKLQYSLAKRPQLTAKWEIVGGKLECRWILT